MFLFRDELATARAGLRAGKSVRIVGARQSGMSTLLIEIARDAEASGLDVSVLRGDLIAEQQPGRLIEEWRAGLGLHRRHRDLGESIDEIAARLHPGSVLVVDDLHLADALSLRAVDVLRRRLGLRLVTAEGLGRDRDADLPPVWPETFIEVTAVDLTTTGMIMREILGGPVAPGALARVYGKSGGAVGVTMAIVESARDRGLLRLEHGSWGVAGRTLWSRELMPFVDGLLIGCRETLRALVRHTAWNGPLDLDALTEKFGLELVEEGVERGFLTTASGPGETVLQVWPPVLVDRFRETPIRVLHRREAAMPSAFLPGSVPHSGERNEGAILARTFATHLEQVLPGLYAAWRETRLPAEGLAYLTEALGLASEAERVDRVMADTRITMRSPDSHELDFILQQVAWRLIEREDEAGAWKQLDTLAAFAPHLAGSVSAVRALFGALRGDGAPPIDFDREHDPIGFATAARAAGAVMRGAVSVAKLELGTLSSNPSLRYLYVYLRAVLQLLDGDPHGALAFIARERKAAAESFDRPLFATLSYTAALVDYYLGDSRAALASIEEGLVIGRPRLTMSPVYAAMLNLQAMAAHFRGQLAVRDDLVRTAAQLSPNPGPFLGTGFDIIETMMTAERDLARTSADRDRDVAAAVRLRADSGYVIGAVQTAAAVLTLEFSDEAARAFVEADARAEETVYRRPARIAGALADRDFDRVVAILDEAPAAHDRNLLLRLVSAAGRRAGLDGDAERSKALIALAAEEFPAARAAMPVPTTSPLSRREGEIARLTATMSNPEIAARLSLSRRTVENHIANALRKTGLRNRVELARFAEEAVAAQG